VTIHVPLFLQPAAADPAIDYTAQEFRQYVRAQLTAASGVGGEQGVTAASGFNVTQRGAGANMSVDVSSGLAYVVGDDVANQGTYQVWNDGTVNVTGWTVPGAGTYHHRLVLQIQDKLSNGAYSGYVAALVPVLDAGGGLPAEPASAITLATIDIPSGSGSITNSMINDYRERVGPVSASRTSDLARTHVTAYTDDPVLQLLNLQANAQYVFWAELGYTGGTGAGEGDITWKFRVSGSTTMSYGAVRNNSNGTFSGAFGFAATETVTGQTQGTGQLMIATLQGTIFTGAAPAYAVLQWAQNTDTGTATTMKAGSFMRAAKLG
jgi:hypothetical protein